MAKSKNRGLAKLQSTLTAEPGKSDRLAIVLPPSPTSTCTNEPSSPREQYVDDEKDDADAWSAQSHTPTESMNQNAGPTAVQAATVKPQANLAGEMSVPSDVLAIAQLQASMKEALQGLANVMDHVGKQSVLMNQLAAEIKARNELSAIQNDLQHQIAKQKEELDSLKTTLESRIKQAAEDAIKSEVKVLVNESIASVIEDRVREELSNQIPDHLRQRGMGHQRQINDVQTELHNSEARRYNASLKDASLDVPLRPLLRPVPTPEQSPYPVTLTSATDSMPNSALQQPRLLVPPPMRRSLSTRSTSSTLPSAISRSQSLQMVAATPSTSALFPKDLKSLFALDSGSTKTLLKEYGLHSTAPSPAVDETMHKFSKPPSLPHSPFERKPPSPVEEESDSDDELKSHMEDMNTFMSHIGVPFKMVPPPKTRETNADKRKKLAPLIISNWIGPR